MLSRIKQVVIVGGILGTAGVAVAQPKPQGTLALGAERLFGFHYSKISPDEGDGDVTVTSFSLLADNVQGELIPFNLPRAGIDYFVADGVSVGGSLIYASTSMETDSGVASSEESITVLGFAPRAGYATMFSEHVGIWPRGGITYMKVDYDESELEMSGFALSLDVPFLLAPSESVAILLGPTLDYALSASAEVGGQSTDFGIFGFGIQAGLAGFI